MSMGLLALTQGQQKKQPVKKRKQQQDGVDMQLLNQVAQLSLATAAQVQAARSTTVDVHIMDRDKQFTEECKAATKAYHDNVKGMSPEDKARQPPPHCIVWEAMCKHMLTNYEAETKMAVGKHVEEIAGAQVNKNWMICDQVKLCRVVPCFKKKQAKVEVSVTVGPPAHEAWTAMRAVLRGKLNAIPIC
eukprot:TRINITY_DN3081_c0_g1_i2.p1 TRINITY_DN3081_c0_g1~~TRINITY_DN3081_c0_g1_i2.p1  ORF type:complete len:189 (-),score=74.69 TRINITY_DN3081_c0_g1_i2:600-1166(-)